jgi:hypothetical protein
MTISGGQRDAPGNTIPKTNFRRDAGPSTALAAHLSAGVLGSFGFSVLLANSFRRKYHKPPKSANTGPIQKKGEAFQRASANAQSKDWKIPRKISSIIEGHPVR